MLTPKIISTIYKGNVDAELVLQAMIDYSKYSQAVIITGDGDFYCLVKYLDGNDELLRVLAPSAHSCSRLLTKVAGKKIAFVSDLRNKLEYIKKEPHKDKTSYALITHSDIRRLLIREEIEQFLPK